MCDVIVEVCTSVPGTATCGDDEGRRAVPAASGAHVAGAPTLPRQAQQCHQDPGPHERAPVS